MKKIITLLIASIYSCSALTLISPGLTSDNRIGKSSSIKFEESSFYGTKIYQVNIFYIEKENTKYIFEDPNNIIDQKIMENFLQNLKETDLIILSEVCFDKEKFRNKQLDFFLYKFSLNGNRYLEKIEYIYPYSFSEKGDGLSLERPLLINDNYPNQTNIVKTSDNFVTCSRSIVKFEKEFQNEGKNILNITTPRNSLTSYEFFIKNGKFEIQNNEDIELNIKLKSRM
ncbi:hypothetical protein JWG40_12175 [Leptospira sp. 201903074]|uniref:hypothetical protein n=1 Tax=Leptospira abararensis TaxID=2810036 RepID=UPI001963389F|nr:hypothetical protein [Leptospira abararensis]MBM9547780.1 hypothetical protein [Leptospira abararensis]